MRRIHPAGVYEAICPYRESFDPSEYRLSASRTVMEMTILCTILMHSRTF